MFLRWFEGLYLAQGLAEDQEVYTITIASCARYTYKTVCMGKFIYF